MLTFDIMMLSDQIKKNIDAEPPEPEGSISKKILAQIVDKQQARDLSKAKTD